MAMLHMIEGPVGAGKTTYANQLGQDLKTAPLVLDDWMATLFRPDRPDDEIWTWYRARKQRCIDQIWHLVQAQIAVGADAIIELGLVQREQRFAFYRQVETAGVDYRVHVLDAPIAERRSRVIARNANRGTTYAMDVSSEVFEMASALWEPVAEAECAGRDVVFV